MGHPTLVLLQALKYTTVSAAPTSNYGLRVQDKVFVGDSSFCDPTANTPHKDPQWLRSRRPLSPQIKGCLNKITPEKYAPLATQIVGYFEPATSDAIVPLIFEKALNEVLLTSEGRPRFGGGAPPISCQRATDG